VHGCGVRVSGATKSCVISVWTGSRLKFEIVGRVSPDRPYEYLREQAAKRIGELKHERLPPVASASDPETLREALAGLYRSASRAEPSNGGGLQEVAGARIWFANGPTHRPPGAGALGKPLRGLFESPALAFELQQMSPVH
jgi:hypothetical protein